MWVWTKVSEHVEGVRFPNLVSCLCFCISMWCFHLIGGWTVKVIVCSPGGKHLGFLPSGSSLLTWMVHLCRLHTVWCLVVTSLLTWAHGCGCGVALFCLGLTDLRLAHQVFRYQFFASRSHPCSHSLAVCHQARWLWSRWFFFFPEVVVVPASFWLWTFLGFLCFLLIFIPWLPLMTSGGLLMMRCLRPGSVTWMLWFQEVCQEGQEEQFHFCVPPWFHLCLCWLCWVCVCLSDQRFGPAVFSGVAIFGFPSLICFFLGWPRRNLLAWWPVSLWLQTNVRVWVDRMDCVFILTLKEHTLQCVACKLRAVLVPPSAPSGWSSFIPQCVKIEAYRIAVCAYICILLCFLLFSASLVVAHAMMPCFTAGISGLGHCFLDGKFHGDLRNITC